MTYERLVELKARAFHLEFSDSLEFIRSKLKPTQYSDVFCEYHKDEASLHRVYFLLCFAKMLIMEQTSIEEVFADYNIDRSWKVEEIDDLLCTEFKKRYTLDISKVFLKQSLCHGLEKLIHANQLDILRVIGEYFPTQKSVYVSKVFELCMITEQWMPNSSVALLNDIYVRKIDELLSICNSLTKEEYIKYYDILVHASSSLLCKLNWDSELRIQGLNYILSFGETWHEEPQRLFIEYIDYLEHKNHTVSYSLIPNDYYLRNALFSSHVKHTLRDVDTAVHYLRTGRVPLQKIDDLLQRAYTYFRFDKKLSWFLNEVSTKYSDIVYHGNQKDKETHREQEMLLSLDNAQRLCRAYIDEKNLTRGKFYEKYETSPYCFSCLLKVVARYDAELYAEYQKEARARMQRRFAIIKAKAKAIIQKLAETDKFTLLDYCLMTRVPIKQMDSIIRSDKELTASEKQLFTIFYRKCSPQLYFFSYEQEKNDLWQIGDHVMTEHDKAKIASFMIRHHIPFYRTVYKQLGRRYVKEGFSLNFVNK